MSFPGRKPVPYYRRTGARGFRDWIHWTGGLPSQRMSESRLLSVSIWATEGNGP